MSKIAVTNKKEYLKKYYLANKDKWQLAHKKRYIKHREEIIAASKKSYLKLRNTEQYKLHRKLANQKFAKTPKGLYKCLKANTKKRGHKEIITQIEFIEWYSNQEKFCYYCNIPESLLEIQGQRRLEIERLDNNLPYIKNNIALACSWCNGVKGNILTESEMRVVGNIIIKEKWICALP